MVYGMNVGFDVYVISIGCMVMGDFDVLCLVVSNYLDGLYWDCYIGVLVDVYGDVWLCIGIIGVIGVFECVENVMYEVVLLYDVDFSVFMFGFVSNNGFGVIVFEKVDVILVSYYVLMNDDSMVDDMVIDNVLCYSIVEVFLCLFLCLGWGVLVLVFVV